MGRHARFFAMVACRLLMYYIMGVVLRLPVLPSPGYIPTPRLPHISLSSLWPACPPGGGTPPGPLSSPLLSPKYNCRTVEPTESPPYTSSHGPSPLLPSSPTPSWSFPTTSAIFQVMIHRRPIAIFVGNRPTKVREFLLRWQVLYIDLGQEPTCLKADL